MCVTTNDKYILALANVAPGSNEKLEDRNVVHAL